MDVQFAIKPEDVPDEFKYLSDAYLDAAENLNAQIASGHLSSSYQRGQVILFLAFHAVELCLKACIMTVNPTANPAHHTLHKLADQINSLVPDLNYCVPFSIEPVSLASSELREKMSANAKLAHQKHRYPANNAGDPWQGVSAFSAQLFQQELQDIRSELVRIRHHAEEYRNGKLIDAP